MVCLEMDKVIVSFDMKFTHLVLFWLWVQDELSKCSSIQNIHSTGIQSSYKNTEQWLPYSPNSKE